MKTKKYCKRCDTTRPVVDFTPSAARYDGLQAYCRECMKLYRKEHYKANPKPYRDRAKAMNKRMREHLREYKSKPCMDCGVQYAYYVMDLDHREGEEKVMNVSRLANNNNWTAYKKELEKCDIVCSNCHRERTHQRRLDKGLPLTV